jgi:hypothetical protein
MILTLTPSILRSFVVCATQDDGAIVILSAAKDLKINRCTNSRSFVVCATQDDGPSAARRAGA